MFSYYHTLAGVMLEGKVSAATFTAEKVADPRFNEARSKVRVKVNPDWPWIAMEYPAPVDVELNDGRRLNKTLSQSIGGPDMPLSDETLVALYRDLAQPLLPEGHIQRTVDLMLHLEQLDNIDELMNILTFQTSQQV